LVYTITETQVESHYFDADEIDLEHHEHITDNFLFDENMTLEIIDSGLNVVETRGVNQNLYKHYTPTEFAELLATYSFEMDVMYNTFVDEEGIEYTVVLKQYLTREDLRIIRNLFTIRLILITLGTILIAIMVFSRFIDQLNCRMGSQFSIMEEHFSEWQKPIETEKLSIIEIRNVAMRYNQQLEINKQQEKRQHQMIASLSHDLRSPITSIKGYVELLDEASDVGSPLAIKYIREGALEIEQLSELLSDQLKYNNSSYELDLKPVEMNGYLQDICAERYKDFEKNNIQVIFDIDERPTYACIDEFHFKRCLLNLINNLLVHNPRGIKAKIASYETDDLYCIDIMDDGIGISTDHKDEIFEAFYSTDVMRKDHNGLGLFISKKIVVKHGGHIELLNSQDYKTIFRITLPNLKKS
jgi:signal transduction histidine kinase